MRYQRSLSTIALAALLGACSGDLHAGKPPRRTGPTPTDSPTAVRTVPESTSTTASSLPAPTAPDPVGFRFEPSVQRCVPQLVPAVVRNWQVAAPRTPQDLPPGVMIGLRNKMAGPNRMEATAGVRGDPRWSLPAPDSFVWARLTTPDAVAHQSRTVSLLPDPPTSWITLSYPGDFADASSLGRGTYTILWITPAGPVACDGFTIS